MKKHIRLAAVLLAAVLVLCACGGSNNANNSNNTNNSNDSGNTPAFDPSKGLDSNGYWDGIKASDYITIPDLNSVVVTKEMMQAEIDELLAEYPNTEMVTDRAVKDGDTVNIDYVGKVDGVEFDGGSTGGEGTDVVVGSGQYIDNMLERLAGHMPGETFDMDATFPDPYESNTELSGKKAVFTITINYIIQETETFWNNAFVTENLADYGWETTEEAEADILTTLKEDAVRDASTFLKDVPQVMIDYNTDTILESYNYYASMYGVDLETFMAYFLGYSSIESFRESYKSTAAERGKYYLIYQALAEKEGYVVTDDILKAYFLEHTESEDYSQYEEAYGIPYLKAMIMYERMSEKISEAVKYDN